MSESSISLAAGWEVWLGQGSRKFEGRVRGRGTGEVKLRGMRDALLGIFDEF
jgi:hypothetical protein